MTVKRKFYDIGVDVTANSKNSDSNKFNIRPISSNKNKVTKVQLDENRTTKKHPKAKQISLKK